jgi:hypothetical protein
MSKIITPVDEIRIQIDNTKSPAPVNMILSRDLPGLYVITILSRLIDTLATNGLMSGVQVPARPKETPPEMTKETSKVIS